MKRDKYESFRPGLNGLLKAKWHIVTMMLRNVVSKITVKPLL